MRYTKSLYNQYDSHNITVHEQEIGHITFKERETSSIHNAWTSRPDVMVCLKRPVGQIPVKIVLCFFLGGVELHVLHNN